jgi:CBS domain-containing protein
MVIVAELMQRDVRTIAEDARLTDAIAALAEGDVSALPVVNRDRELVGVVSSSDILAAEAGSDGRTLGRIAEQMTVGDIMSTTPKSIGPEADIKLAAQEMLYLDVSRLLVVDEGALVGILAQEDIIRAVAMGRI